jgi:uncharacterized lipoprotein YddW (UPF0748 family)
MNEDQQQEARDIWITNIDKETHIYNPDEVSDKLDRLDTTGRAE